MFSRFLAIVTLVGFGFASAASAKEGALIDYEDGKTSAQLAKSWKKVKDGEYEFELDLTKDVGSKKLSADLVKDSLEAKFADKYKMAVKAKGASTVNITWQNMDEAQFLDRVAKTKIRSSSVEVAMQESASDGGMRANDPNRMPLDGEVKGIVIGSKADHYQVKVSTSKYAGIKGGVVKVANGGKKASNNSIIFFKPSKDNKGIWSTSEMELIDKKSK